ncbi:hypothetical protein CFP56_024022 [Quercus suber]|uniref:Uncharacterized protein n=1 Tax=Quercus suber TaxID=58331 RepID=A0AAW0KAN0_QUESU
MQQHSALNHFHSLKPPILKPLHVSSQHAPSFLLVKRFVEGLWGQYGLVEENSYLDKNFHLPVEYWNHICLEHVASGVGRPLYADTVTEVNQRLSFTWVFVDVDPEFPREI